MSSSSAAREHDRWEELAVGSALDALEPADEQAFQQHTLICPLCRQTVADTRVVMAELAYAAMPADPPPTLRAAIVAAVEGSERPPVLQQPAPEVASTARAETPVVELDSRRVRRRRAVLSPWMGAAASLVLVLALVVWNLVLQAQNSTTARQNRVVAVVLHCVEDSACRTVPLKSRSGQTEATALVRSSRVELVVNGLARNDVKTQTYVLWRVPQGGAPVAMAVFDVTKSGPTVIPVPPPKGELRPIDGLAISKEAGRRAPETGSTPLVVGSVSA